MCLAVCVKNIYSRLSILCLHLFNKWFQIARTNRNCKIQIEKISAESAELEKKIIELIGQNKVIEAIVLVQKELKFWLK